MDATDRRRRRRPDPQDPQGVPARHIRYDRHGPGHGGLGQAGEPAFLAGQASV